MHFGILFVSFCLFKFTESNLQPIVEWKQLDYLFPNSYERQLAIDEQRFNASTNVILDTDVHYRANKPARIFVTIPRFEKGIPVTLGTVSDLNTPRGPYIIPYPSYDWHKPYGKNCDAITSVFRIMIDECQRLWVLDTGKLEFDYTCDPQILVFDLNTDQLIHRYRIPKDQVNKDTVFVSILVDVQDPLPGKCLNTKAYLADVRGFLILVYDLAAGVSWKITHDLFKPEPNFMNFSIAGESFELPDGIMSLALRKKAGFENVFQHDSRELYFHSLASTKEGSVPLIFVNNGAAFMADEKAYANQFRVIGDRGFQSSAEAMDSAGNLFFGLWDPIGIGCWDSSTPYIKENLHMVAQNNETLQFASGMKVVKNLYNQEELWVATMKLQKILLGTYNWNQINFRIQAIQIKDILKGAQKCGAHLNPQYQNSNSQLPYFG